MRKIGFIGAYDKTDMILYVAKILVTMNQRVLMIDSTMNQKAKYVVPVINPTTSYVTTFEDIDVSVGFETEDEIKKYLGISGEELPYDILLIDADTPEKVENFNLKQADKNYFVTSFDVYSLKKGLEILSNIKETLKLTKVLFAKEMLKEDDDYLNFLSEDYLVSWEENQIYFPIENGDLCVIAENQRVAKVKLKKLSTPYKDGLVYLVEEIAKGESEMNIRRIVKMIEKGV